MTDLRDRLTRAARTPRFNHHLATRHLPVDGASMTSTNPFENLPHVVVILVREEGGDALLPGGVYGPFATLSEARLEERRLAYYDLNVEVHVMRPTFTEAQGNIQGSNT